MPPQTPNQNNGPQPSYTPPSTGYGAPQQPAFQQNPNGQYAVVPPPNPIPGPGNGGHNPYEFIVNPQKANRPASLFGGGNALLMRVAVIGGGLVLILIIASVIITSLAPKGPTTGLTAIAQRQQEIIRISTDAATKASSQDAKNFAITTELTITSSQQQTVAYLKSSNVKVSDKTLALSADATSDATLANAQSAGTYDSAVVRNLTDQLQTYEGLLQSTFKQASSPAAKQLLQSDFTTADTLLKQAKNISSSSFGS